MPGPLTYATLKKAMGGTAAAFRCVAEYEPEVDPIV